MLIAGDRWIALHWCASTYCDQVDDTGVRLHRRTHWLWHWRRQYIYTSASGEWVVPPVQGGPKTILLKACILSVSHIKMFIVRLVFLNMTSVKYSSAARPYCAKQFSAYQCVSLVLPCSAVYEPKKLLPSSWDWLISHLSLATKHCMMKISETLIVWNMFWYTAGYSQLGHSHACQTNC